MDRDGGEVFAVLFRRVIYVLKVQELGVFSHELAEKLLALGRFYQNSVA